MHLTSQFTVIDSEGERHTVSAWRGMTTRSTSGGIEFVPVIMQYRVDEGHMIVSVRPRPCCRDDQAASRIDGVSAATFHGISCSIRLIG